MKRNTLTSSPTDHRRKILAVASLAVIAINSMFVVFSAAGFFSYFTAFGIIPITFIATSLWILVAVGRERRRS